MAYAEVEDLRGYLEDAPAGAEYDELFGKILERATSMVDLRLGFSFAGYSAAAARIIQTYGQRTLSLPPHKPGSVTVVLWDAYAITDYVVETDSGLYRSAGWGIGRYTITAEWGYGDPPEALVEVVLEIAINIWKSKDRGMWQETIGQTGAGGIRFTGGLTKQQADIIDAVREKYGDQVSV